MFRLHSKITYPPVAISGLRLTMDDAERWMLGWTFEAGCTRTPAIVAEMAKRCWYSQRMPLHASLRKKWQKPRPGVSKLLSARRIYSAATSHSKHSDISRPALRGLFLVVSVPLYQPRIFTKEWPGRLDALTILARTSQLREAWQHSMPPSKPAVVLQQAVVVFGGL